MSCRHDLANGNCSRCYPSTGKIDPGDEADYEPNMEGPGAVTKEQYEKKAIESAKTMSHADWLRQAAKDGEKVGVANEDGLLVNVGRLSESNDPRRARFYSMSSQGVADIWYEAEAADEFNHKIVPMNPELEKRWALLHELRQTVWSAQPDHVLEEALRLARHKPAEDDKFCAYCGRLDMQAMVKAFNVKFGIERGERPEIRKIRAKLIEEEARETVDAIRAGDLVEAVDGLCDLLHVVFGAADVFGVNLAPFFKEVHRTNMLKVGGGRREDGKILKPEGWEPPKIREMLEELSKKGG